MEELIVRNVNQGEGAVAWRQILGEYASTEPGNVLAMWSKLGDLRSPQGSDNCGRHQQDGRGHDQVPQDGRRKSVRHRQARHPHEGLTNEAELQKHVFRNSTRLSTYEKMREEVMSALTAERAVHDPMEIGAVGKSGKKGTGKKGKGKNDQKGLRKGPGQGKGPGPRTPCRSRVLLLSPEGPHQRGVQNSYR